MQLIGNGKRLNAEINVTPMIDVLLVLLVIFMIVTPVTSVGLDASVPQPADDSSSGPDNPLVLTIAPDRAIQLNQQPIEMAALPARLAGIRALRARGVVFIQADPSLAFQDVAEVIDVVRGADLQVSLMGR